MSQRERDLVRIAQGTALVVARFMELRPAHSSSATAWPAAAAEYAGLAAAFAARAGYGSAGGSGQRPSARPGERQGTFSRAPGVYSQSAGASAAAVALAPRASIMRASIYISKPLGGGGRRARGGALRSDALGSCSLAAAGAGPPIVLVILQPLGQRSTSVYVFGTVLLARFKVIFVAPSLP